MEDIYKQIRSVMSRGERGALASVVSRDGSAPMSSDARMLVLQDGSVRGTVGGGCLEAEVWSEAKRVLRQDRATRMSFELGEENAKESGHICGGVVGILVEPLSNFDRKVLSEIIRIRDEGGTGVFARVVSRSDGKPPGLEDRVLVYLDGSMLGCIKGLEAEISRKAAGIVQEGKPDNDTFILPDSSVRVEVFFEPVTSRPRVYIFGGGHVSKRISKVAGVAGFRPVIVEDRPQFADMDIFPEAEELIVIKGFDCLKAEMPQINPTDMAVIVTRGHQHDETTLAWAWNRPFRYLGMIGSRTKVLTTYRRLKKKMGVSQEEFIKRVHAPMGLEIGADTPGEIAVAIVAELIQVCRESLIRNPDMTGRPKRAALM